MEALILIYIVKIMIMR